MSLLTDDDLYHLIKYYHYSCKTPRQRVGAFASSKRQNGGQIDMDVFLPRGKYISYDQLPERDRSALRKLMIELQKAGALDVLGTLDSAQRMFDRLEDVHKKMWRTVSVQPNRNVRVHVIEGSMVNPQVADTISSTYQDQDTKRKRDDKVMFYDYPMSEEDEDEESYTLPPPLSLSLPESEQLSDYDENEEKPYM